MLNMHPRNRFFRQLHRCFIKLPNVIAKTKTSNIEEESVKEKEYTGAEETGVERAFPERAGDCSDFD